MFGKNSSALLISTCTAIVGGLACWLPSIVIHAVRGETFSSLDVLILSACLPVMGIGVAYAADWLTSGLEKVASTPRLTCLGLWIMGPIAMFISAMPSGGFAKVGSVSSVVLLTAMFPLSTFMLSSYDGSLFGLIVGTSVLLNMNLPVSHSK